MVAGVKARFKATNQRLIQRPGFLHLGGDFFAQIRYKK